ncbi:MAG TPA: hypothetical protein V6D07_19315 [Trichocoleus sp.]
MGFLDGKILWAVGLLALAFHATEGCLELASGTSFPSSAACPTTVMTSNFAVVIIPGLAIGYLLLVYGLLLLAKRAERPSRPGT